MDKLSRVSIEPWLTVSNGKVALEFYTAAFGAITAYKMETPDGGLVAQLIVQGAGFWISGGADDVGSETNKAESIRMIITIDDPDTLFNVAIKAGAREVFAVAEEYGWRLGRLEDPFGHHWEIGHPLTH